MPEEVESRASDDQESGFGFVHLSVLSWELGSLPTVI